MSRTLQGTGTGKDRPSYRGSKAPTGVSAGTGGTRSGATVAVVVAGNSHGHANRHSGGNTDSDQGCGARSSACTCGARCYAHTSGARGGGGTGSSAGTHARLSESARSHQAERCGNDQFFHKRPLNQNNFVSLGQYGTAGTTVSSKVADDDAQRQHQLQPVTRTAVQGHEPAKWDCHPAFTGLACHLFAKDGHEKVRVSPPTCARCRPRTTSR